MGNAKNSVPLSVCHIWRKIFSNNFVINRDGKSDNLYGGLTVFSDEDEIVWESVLNNA